MSSTPMTTQSRLVAPPTTLPLQSVAVRVDARGGIARTCLEQRFHNPHPDPLAITYVLALPADAAVSGFAFAIGERRIQGQIDRTAAARERFEEAIAAGKTAGLLEQHRSSLFRHDLGNIPPGADVVAEISIDQRLGFAEGSWEWRFPLAAAPRYLGEPGRVADASRLALDVAPALQPCASIHLDIHDTLAEGCSPQSPSHPIKNTNRHVELASSDGAALDRDIVVRWPVATSAPTAIALAERYDDAEAHALITLVPPRGDSKAPTFSRDLILLLDTSGSMSGAPLEQARRVAMALVDGLDDRDRIELIAFSNAPRCFHRGPVAASRDNKRAALAWLAALQAAGGTEMHEALLEALRPLRKDSQRQVVLVTDGLIGFEAEIVKAILERLPRGSRVHCVGVGAAVNRSLTGPAARAGRGVEVILGADEDPERAVQRIRSRTEQPIVVDVTLGGSALLEAAPAKVPDLFAGGPVLVFARVKADGGELVVTGRTAEGTWDRRVPVTFERGTGALARLFAREAVEEAEMRLAAGADRSEVETLIERLGLKFRIETRLTSWVAIDEKPSVDPRAPTRRETIPQMLPHGMSVEGLGLRAAPTLPANLLSRTMFGFRSFGAAPVRGFGRKVPPELLSMRFAASAPTERVRGRVVAQRGVEMIIDVEILEPFLWKSPEETVVCVWFADWTLIRATADRTKTTASSQLAVGQHARLVLTLASEPVQKAVLVTFEPTLGYQIPLA